MLDDSSKIVSEKNSAPNKNSLRGFEVVDEIKAKMEEAVSIMDKQCPTSTIYWWEQLISHLAHGGNY
jgi:hypothetical protein